MTPLVSLAKPRPTPTVLPEPVPLPPAAEAAAEAPAGVSEDGPADEGNLPGFLHVALRYDLALSPPEQRGQIIARVAGITTRGQARQYLEEVAQRAAAARAGGGP
jgi:phospholipase C